MVPLIQPKAGGVLVRVGVGVFSRNRVDVGVGVEGGILEKTTEAHAVPDLAVIAYEVGLDAVQPGCMTSLT